MYSLSRSIFVLAALSISGAVAVGHGVPNPVVLVALIDWCAKNRAELKDVVAEMDKRMSADDRQFWAEMRGNLSQVPAESVISDVSAAERNAFCDALKVDISKPAPPELTQ